AVPRPERSARREAVSGPVTMTSAGVVRSPRSLAGSLLWREVMWHTGSRPQLSLAATDTVTGTSLWLAGLSTSGSAVMLVTAGAVESTTVTTVVSSSIWPKASITLRTYVSAPSGWVSDAVRDSGTMGPSRLWRCHWASATLSSGSLLAPPSRLTAAPAAEVHSTIWAAPARATGG